MADVLEISTAEDALQLRQGNIKLSAGYIVKKIKKKEGQADQRSK